MPTVVSKVIGSGGDYSTVQAWEDAKPANLVTSDQVWQGLLKNQEFTTSGNVVTIAGSTTDATRYAELTTDTGASFVDNGSVRTNALKYNASNGAALRNSSNGYVATIRVEEANARLSKLQVSSIREAVLVVSGATNVWVDKCILASSNTANSGANWQASGGKLTNSVVYRTGSGTATLLNTSATFTCVNVTLAACSDVTAATYAISQSYPSSAVYTNVAAFGCTNAVLGTGSTTFTTCRTSAASPPSGWSTVAYDTSTGSGFEGTSVAAADFRLKSSSALIDIGTTDTTNAAVDISGTARPQGSAYDVGAWEYASAGSSYSVSVTEAATAGEASSGSMVLPAASAEAATASDAITATGLLTAAAAETITAVDAISSALAAAAAVAESATAAESLNTGGVTSNTLTEAVSAADSLAALAALGAAISDTVTVTDLVVSTLAAVAAVAEAASLAEQQSTGPVLSATMAETAAAADALQAAASLVAQVAEAASAGETMQAAQQLVALLTEAATAADSVASAAASTYSVSLTELATALDQIVAALTGDSAFAAAVFRTARGTSTTRVVKGTARNSIRGYQ